MFKKIIKLLLLCWYTALFLFIVSIMIGGLYGLLNLVWFAIVFLLSGGGVVA